MNFLSRIKAFLEKPSNAVTQMEGEAGQILGLIKSVIDPELNVNIVDLGLIRSVEKIEDRFIVKMTLTTRGCPVGPILVEEAEKAAQRLGHKVEVILTWEPPWTVDDISPDGKAIIDGGGEQSVFDELARDDLTRDDLTRDDLEHS